MPTPGAPEHFDPDDTGLSSSGMEISAGGANFDLERIRLAPEDLACGPSGMSGPWRLVAAAGGRQLNDLEFRKPFDLDWRKFSLLVMHRALIEGATIHFDLTHLRDLADLLEGDGPWGKTISAIELRWLRSVWGDYPKQIIFWDEIEYGIAESAFGRRTSPPWEWESDEFAVHESHFESEDDEIAA